MAKNKILIICGEPSGDLHAAGLAQALKKLNPEIEISGVGGECLRKAGADIYCAIKELAVFGFFDALRKLPKFLSLKKLILEKIKEEKPKAIVLIDFSGFNLRLASSINKSIPVIYYVSPQVWASRQGRIEAIKKYIHKMIVIFKFEEEFYKKYGVDADFVGHPLLDIVSSSAEKKEDRPTIALLPGSRKQEIKNILPIMLKSAQFLAEKLKDAQFIIAKSPQVGWDIYEHLTKDKDIDLKIIEGRTYDCLKMSDFCLVASGTATLETAIMHKPFLIIYKLGWLNYFLYRPQVKVPYIGMVNLIAGAKIIPEFIQFEADPQKISAEALRIINDPEELQRIKLELAKVKASLGESGAAERASRIILNFLNLNK